MASKLRLVCVSTALAAVVAAVACGPLATAVEFLARSPITALLAKGNALALIP
ncbi:MAG TPA: hypothetical protein VFB08_13860 [Burkholderiales bacterium]|nr:hypothetical protein [Burkholderiales bacterium]